MADASTPDNKVVKHPRFRGLLGNLQELLARRLWSQQAGLTFEGKRDLYEVFGYNKNPGFLDYEFMYERGGIAKRIVEAPADACWSDPPIIEGSSRFKKAWDDLVTRQKVFLAIYRLDLLVGLGRYGVLLVGYDDGRPLTSPANTPTEKNVTYLQPYPEGSVSIISWDEDPTSPRFGLPTMYEIDPEGAQKNLQKNTLSTVIRRSIKVHWTRILHVAENTTDNPLYGRSRLAAVFNHLQDLEKVSGGSAETYWMVANRGMQLDIDKEMELDEDTADALTEEIEEYQHQLRRYIRTRGVKITPLGESVSDPRGTFSILVNLISGTTGIPQRILIGSEAGQLASEQDRANWANRVAERTAKFAAPVVLLPFIEMQIRNNALPTPKQMSVTWPDPFKLSPLERGQASAQMARSAANLAKVMSTPIAEDGSGMAVVEETEEMETTTQGPPNPDGSPGKPTKTKTMVPTKKVKPSTTLFTVDEARQIIGFGKHAPVFDDAQDSDPTNKAVGKA